MIHGIVEVNGKFYRQLYTGKYTETYCCEGCAFSTNPVKMNYCGSKDIIASNCKLGYIFIEVPSDSTLKIL